MPAIDDFPPNAQREYWAKSAGNTKAMPIELQPARKPGLLERIAGGVRDRLQQGAMQPNSQGSQEQVDLPVFFENERRK
jgi:hypothetical protein